MSQPEKSISSIVVMALAQRERERLLQEEIEQAETVGEEFRIMRRERRRRSLSTFASEAE